MSDGQHLFSSKACILDHDNVGVGVSRSRNVHLATQMYDYSRTLPVGKVEDFFEIAS